MLSIVLVLCLISPPVAGAASGAVVADEPTLSRIAAVETPPQIQSATTQRISGAGASGTSIAASQQGWTTSSVVVIAPSKSVTLQVLAGPLAGAYSAPLLVSQSGRAPSTALLNEVKRLRATSVFLVGPRSTLPSTISDRLRRVGVRSVTRVSGKTTADTARMIAGRIRSKKGGLYAAVIVNSSHPEYAVGAVPMAGILGMPILLTGTKRLDPYTASALKSYRPKQLLYAGSTKSIPSGIARSARSAAKLPTTLEMRISGSDVYDFAARFAELGFAQGMTYANVSLGANLTSGDLAVSAVFASRQGGSVIVSRAGSLPTRTLAFLLAHCTAIKNLYVFGPSSAISETQLASVTDALKTEIQPDVKLMNDDLGSHVTSISPDWRTIYFDGAVDLSSVETSDVVVSDATAMAPRGFFRRVLRVNPTSNLPGMQSIDTTGATLAEIIKKGSVDIRTEPEPSSSGVSALSTPPTMLPAGDYTLGSISVPLNKTLYSNGPVNLTTSGSFRAAVGCVISCSWGWEWFWPYVKSFEFSVYFDQSLDLTVRMTAAWSGSKEVGLGEIPLGALTFSVGPIPISLNFSAEPILGVSASFEASAAVHVKQSFYAKCGFRYTSEGGGAPFTETRKSCTFDSLGAGGKGQVKGWVGVKLKVEAYDSVGLFATPDVFVELKADTSWKPMFRMWYGLEAYWGVGIDFWGFEKEWKFGPMNIYRRLIYPEGIPEGDKTPPTTTIAAPKADGLSGWYRAKPTFTLKASELADTWWAFVPWSTSGPPKSLGDIFKLGAMYANAAKRIGLSCVPSEGAWVLGAQSQDVSENLGNANYLYVRYDPTAPTIDASLSYGIGTTGVGSAMPKVVDATSGLSGVSFSWSRGASETPDTTFDSVDAAGQTPKVTLAEGTWYFNLRARDRAGNWSTTRSWPVTVDKTAPSVRAVTPAAGAVGVPTTSTIAVTFSEPMSSASLAAGIQVTRSTDGVTLPVDATVSYDAATRTARITPSEGLLSYSEYRVVLSPDVRHAVQDVAGNALPFTSWGFTTGDGDPPRVYGQWPLAGSSVSPGPLRIEAWFDEPVDVSGATFSVERSEYGEVWYSVPVTPVYDSDTYIWHATTSVDTGWVRVRISGARDAAGNVMQPVEWLYSVGGL